MPILPDTDFGEIDAARERERQLAERLELMKKLRQKPIEPPEIILSRDAKGRPTLVQTPWGQLAIDYADWRPPPPPPPPPPKPDFEVVLSRDSKGRPTLVQTPYGQLAIDYADNWAPPQLTVPQPKVESKPSLGPPEVKLDTTRFTKSDVVVPKIEYGVVGSVNITNTPPRLDLQIAEPKLAGLPGAISIFKFEELFKPLPEPATVFFAPEPKPWPPTPPPNAQKPPQSPVKIEPPPVTPPPPPPPPPTALEDRLEEALKRVEQQRERERQLAERLETVKTKLPNHIRALPVEVAPQLPKKKPTPLPTKA
jgi:hypothetical protein